MKALKDISLVLVLALLELAETISRWAFIIGAPVYVLAAIYYFKSHRPYLEALGAFVAVSALYFVFYWISPKLKVFLTQPKYVPDDFTYIGEDSSRYSPRRTEEMEDTKGKKAVADREQQRQRNAENWRQANPWGGYNPYE